MKRIILILAALFVCLGAPATAQAHYQPGDFPLDLLTNLPPFPGVYYVENMLYYSGDASLSRDLLNGRVPATLNLNVGVFAANQMVVWQTGEKFLGADYAAGIAVPMMQPSVGSELDFGLRFARQGSSSNFGLGDVLILPLMLGWHGEKYDALFSYGVYAPTGEFAPLSPSNIGRGFWTNQFQLGGAYYLDDERSWSLNLIGTYEANTTRSTGFYPGNYMSLDWGIRKKLDEQWSVALTGYDTWQLDPASSGFGFNNQITNQAHAIGGEVGVTIPEANHLGITLKYSHEYESFARFQGDLVTLTFSVPIDMQLPSAPPPQAQPAAPPAEPAPSPESSIAPPPGSESAPGEESAAPAEAP